MQRDLTLTLAVVPPPNAAWPNYFLMFPHGLFVARRQLVTQQVRR
jgi:hypothetical protein